MPNKSKSQFVDVPESEPLRNECLHFLEYCPDGRVARTDGREGLRVLQVLGAVQHSLDLQGEAVRPGLEMRIQKSEVQPQPSSAFPASSSDYFVRPTAVIDEGAIIGKGTKIWH